LFDLSKHRRSVSTGTDFQGYQMPHIFFGSHLLQERAIKSEIVLKRGKDVEKTYETIRTIKGRL